MKQVSNEVIADKIKMLSKLMDLHNENAFKSKSYNNAAFQIDKCKTEIVDMQDTEILALPGIGSSVLKTIREIVETGTIKELDELLAKTPIGILDIMNIKGLGPKKVSTIWKNL
jgi:DNA polymerase (family 10)